MGLSVWQILIVALLFVLLFGKGKISDLMGDLAKGIKSFKKGMSDETDEQRKVAQTADQPIDVTPGRVSEQKRDGA